MFKKFTFHFATTLRKISLPFKGNFKSQLPTSLLPAQKSMLHLITIIRMLWGKNAWSTWKRLFCLKHSNLKDSQTSWGCWFCLRYLFLNFTVFVQFAFPTLSSPIIDYITILTVSSSPFQFLSEPMTAGCQQFNGSMSLYRDGLSSQTCVRLRFD